MRGVQPQDDTQPRLDQIGDRSPVRGSDLLERFVLLFRQLDLSGSPWRLAHIAGIL